jgi:hypothetical protein
MLSFLNKKYHSSFILLFSGFQSLEIIVFLVSPHNSLLTAIKSFCTPATNSGLLLFQNLENHNIDAFSFITSISKFHNFQLSSIFLLNIPDFTIFTSVSHFGKVISISSGILSRRSTYI